MNGSLDVRKFLRQQEDRLPRSSASVPAQRSGEPERISAEQVYRARMAVARSAADADDCRLLEMLGLVPDEDGQPGVRQRSAGAARTPVAAVPQPVAGSSFRLP